jgi:hypothetical protein
MSAATVCLACRRTVTEDEALKFGRDDALCPSCFDRFADLPVGDYEIVPA